jgi:hypothetical protein
MEHLPQIIWPLASAALAISVIATAIVQLFKDLFPFRRQFQRNFVANWFSERHAARSTGGEHKQLLGAENDLIHLATGGEKSAFYDLEPAQLCGQMNSAAQIALAYPDRHPDLIRFLAPEANPEDIQKIVESAGTNAALTEPSAMNELLDARNRVTHHLQRSIDALQIAMGFRWKFYLQLGVYLICFGCAFLALFAVKGGKYTFWEACAVAVVAGFASPIISDFAAAINRWRKP